MHKRRTMIVPVMTMLAMLALAGPAFAGGQPDDPAPSWLGTAVVVAVLVAGAFHVSVVASGFVLRRRRR